MSMRRHEPVPVEQMEKTRYHGHHTICQFLRDIYAMTDNEEIKMKCRIGMSMTKSMHERLKVYRKLNDGRIIAKIEGDNIEFERANPPE